MHGWLAANSNDHVDVKLFAQEIREQLHMCNRQYKQIF